MCLDLKLSYALQNRFQSRITNQISHCELCETLAPFVFKLFTNYANTLLVFYFIFLKSPNSLRLFPQVSLFLRAKFAIQWLH